MQNRRIPLGFSGNPAYAELREDAKILSQTMVESTQSKEFTLIPKGFRDKLLPFTGAFNGWPIGRMTSLRESEETRLWLENWEKASGKVR